MTGMVRCCASVLIVSFLFGWRGRSSVSRPWIAMAATPVPSIIFTRRRLSSIWGTIQMSRLKLHKMMVAGTTTDTSKFSHSGWMLCLLFCSLLLENQTYKVTLFKLFCYLDVWSHYRNKEYRKLHFQEKQTSGSSRILQVTGTATFLTNVVKIWSKKISLRTRNNCSQIIKGTFSCFCKLTKLKIIVSDSQIGM